MNKIYEPKTFFPEYESPEERARLPYLDTIPKLLDFCTEQYAENNAVIDGERKITYKALSEETAKRRYALADIPVGAPVGIMCRSRTEAQFWFLAVTTSGRIAVMLPPINDSERYKAMAAMFRLAATAIDDTDLDLGDAPKVIRSSDVTDDTAPAADVKKETPCAVFFTGGSTGTPKGVLLAQGSLTRGAHCGTFFRSGSVFGNSTIALLPIYHIFGAVAGFLGCLYSGTEIYIFKDIPTSIGMIPRVKPTMLVLVPGIVDILLNMAKLRGKGFLGNLKSIICGGAAVPQKLITGMLENGVRVYPGYGLTEAANFTSANLAAEEHPNSIGRLYPNQQMKIVDGELWIKGDNIMLGYYGNKEETDKVMEDGWLKTGDLVTIDDEGFITVTGRKKNMIVLSNGENIYPEKLEVLVNESPMVKDCLVSEKERNGAPVLAIEIMPDMTYFQGKEFTEIEKTINEYVNSINKTLDSYQHFNLVTVRKEDFKRMPSMKIDRLHN